MFSSDTLNLLTIVLSVLGALSLAYGYFLPRLMIKGHNRKPQHNDSRFLLGVFIVRGATIESVVIYSLILGILGAGLEVVAPFFIIAFAGLLLTFPTQAKYSNMAAMLKTPTENRMREERKIS